MKNSINQHVHPAFAGVLNGFFQPAPSLRKFAITLRQPGGIIERYTGLFPCSADAAGDGVDRADAKASVSVVAL